LCSRLFLFFGPVTLPSLCRLQNTNENEQTARSRNLGLGVAIFARFTRDIVAFGDQEHQRKKVEPTFDLHDKIIRKYKISEREDALSIGTTGEVHRRTCWRLASILN
jgi:hypothetical protein